MSLGGTASSSSSSAGTGARLDVRRPRPWTPRTNTNTSRLTYDFNEFHRVRAAFSQETNSLPGAWHNDVVGLQWTAFIGRHVHGFRDR